MKIKNEDFAKQNRPQLFIFHSSIFIIFFCRAGACLPPFFIQTNILCVILSERSESNFCEVQRSKRAKAQGEAVAGSLMEFCWLCQTNVTFFKKRQQNMFRDPFVALAPRFVPFASLTTQTSTPLRSAQDDTKRGKYQIYLFLGPSRTPVPTVWGSYHLRSNARNNPFNCRGRRLDDPEK